MSIELKAVRGAIWTIVTNVGSRGVGLVCTLVVTRFIATEVYGEIAVAQGLLLTANVVTALGVGNYVVAHPKADRKTVFHASFFYLAAGALAIGATFALRNVLGPVLGAPNIAAFVPGLTIAALLDRVQFIPERILARDLQFRYASIQKSAGELAYALVSVALAVAGWGGMAIVAGSIVRSLLKTIMCLAVVSFRDWLEPHRLRKDICKDVLGFGLVMNFANLGAFAAMQFDNFLVARYFGTSVTGMYKLAYSLADVPASNVGEQIGDVLMPSFAHMSEQQRKTALGRALGMLALVVFPLAIGLGAVSESVVRVLLSDQWRGVAPMLAVLSALSIARPVSWTIDSYLIARHVTLPIMVLELLKVGVLMASIATFGRLHPLATCGAVGVAFGGHALATAWVVRRIDGVPIGSVLAPLVRPLAACVPMAAAAIGIRWALGVVHAPAAVSLAAEIAGGAVAYVGSAFLIANAASKEMIALLRRALKRRRGGESDEDSPESE